MRRIDAGALIAAVLAAGAAAVVALARTAPMRYPVGDIALIELYTRDALAGRLLEGPYSHFPWHHPGPLYFYLLAPFYVLGRQTPAALNAGAAIVAFVSVGAIFWIAARGRSAWIAPIVTTSVVAYAVRFERLAVSVWNPHVVVLPAAAALIAAGGLAAGEAAMLPALAAAASFVVQTDVALAPIMAMATVAAIAAFSRQRRFTPRELIAGVVLTAILWTGPILEQAAAAREGNLIALWRFFVGRAASHQTFAAALDAWAGMIAAPFRRQVLLPTGGALAQTPALEVVFAGLLTVSALAAGVFALRRGERWVGWFGILSGLASLVALWSVTRIDGAIADHQVFWISIVGVLALAALASIGAAFLFASMRLKPHAATHLGPIASIAVVLAFVLFSSGEMNRVRQGSAPVTEFLPSIAVFGESIRHHLETSGARLPLVRIDQAQWGVAAGILLQLQRLGVPFHVEESWASMFPRDVRERGNEDLELTIAATGSNPQLSKRTGDVVIDISTHVEVHAIALPRR